MKTKLSQKRFIWKNCMRSSLKINLMLVKIIMLIMIERHTILMELSPLEFRKGVLACINFFNIFENIISLSIRWGSRVVGWRRKHSFRLTMSINLFLHFVLTMCRECLLITLHRNLIQVGVVQNSIIIQVFHLINRLGKIFLLMMLKIIIILEGVLNSMWVMWSIWMV